MANTKHSQRTLYSVSIWLLIIGNFVNNFAEIVRPLGKLLANSKGKKLKRLEIHSMTFDKMKKRLTEAAVLAFPSEEGKYISMHRMRRLKQFYRSSRKEKKRSMHMSPTLFQKLRSNIE